MSMLVAKRRGAAAVPVSVTGSSVTTVATSGGVTSATVNYPSGSASGDLIVLHVFTFRNAVGTYTHGTPTNWNVAKTVDNQSAGQRHTVLWRVRGAETSVQLTSSVAVFWHVSVTSLKDFYAAAPIENITDSFFLVETAQFHETMHLPVGSAAGVLYWGGSAYGATGTRTELWERGAKLQDVTLAPSGVAAFFNFSTAFESVPSAGVVRPNIIKHSASATQQHGIALAIRPASWTEPAPLLDTVSPRAAGTGGGDTITLTGVGFQGAGATTATVVKVNGVAVATANVNVIDTGRLTFVAPAGSAGTASVTVTTSAGASNAVSLTYAAVSSAGMDKSGTQSVGANTTAKVTGWAAQAGTPAGAIVNNELVVSADGTISITATIGTSSTMNTSYIMIYKNGVEVARSATTSAASWSVTWTGSAVNTDSFAVYVRNGYFLSRTVNSGSLAYTLGGVPADPGLPATVQVAADGFDGTGPLSANWFTTGGGVLDRLNGELNGDSTPSTPISFAWWKAPVGTSTQEVRCRVRWNGRSPEHSACGLVVRADPWHSTGNPGTRGGVQFTFTATIMALYYEDYNAANGFVPVTGTAQYVNLGAKFPEGALVVLRAEGNTYTALVDGVVQLQGTVPTDIVPVTNHIVGTTIQNDQLEPSGGGPPGRLDDFVALIP